MGCFVISQTAAGVRFLLRSDAGQTLAVSKNYASLDTCKKGIRSLITILPGAPVVNLCAGERGPNPKCEIDGKEGAYIYRYKSSNGKVVIESRPVQTEKAALRAISMLKEAVEDPKMMFWQKEGYVPLRLKLPEEGAKKADLAEKAPERVEKKPESENIAVTLPGDFLIPPEAFSDPPETTPPAEKAVEITAPAEKAAGRTPPPAETAQAAAKAETPGKTEAPAPKPVGKTEAPAPKPVGKTEAPAPKPAEKAERAAETIRKVPQKQENAPAKKRSIFGIFGRIHKLR